MDIAAEVSHDDPRGGGSSARSRTTGAIRRPPPSRRAASRCSASCCRVPCWRRLRNDPRTQRRSQGVWAAGTSGLRGGRRRPVGAAGRSQPDLREALAGAVLSRARCVGPRTAGRCRLARGRRGAVPQRRLLGAPLPGRRATRPTDGTGRRRTDRRRRQPARRCRGRRRLRWAAVTLDGRAAEWPAGRDGTRLRRRTGAVGDRR